MNAHRLNAIAPYFTMFPLDIPLSVLEEARPGEGVLDPFAGRGTTAFAARLLGLPSLSVDISPVAVAIAEAKLVSPTPAEILREAEALLKGPPPREVPEGPFWRGAYHPEVLEGLCRLREGLKEASTPAQIALRGLLLGALHGPLRGRYLSNQMPRTFAPKPDYALRFWKARGLEPPKRDLLEVIRWRAERFYAHPLPRVPGRVVLGDSRDPAPFLGVRGFRWVVTSPPYWGMRTYVPDQWLRNWFLGGPPRPEYRYEGQLGGGSLEAFVLGLRQVWTAILTALEDGARMVVRFGSLGSKRGAHPAPLLEASLEGTPWRLREARPVPPPPRGRRQAESFRSPPSRLEEWDFWCELR